MNFFKVFGGCLLSASIFFIGCKEQTIVGQEVETAISFSVTELHIPVQSKASLTISVTPAEKASEVIFDISDKKIADFSSDASINKDGVISLELESFSLGETSLTAILDDLIESCPVIIDPIPVSAVSLNIDNYELSVGDQLTLVASVKPENATNATVVWSTDKPSEDESVVKVENGVVTAIKAGETVVTASCGEFSASCTIKVKDVEAESIVLNLSEKEVTEGETFYIDATVSPSNITYKSVNWTSSNLEVVSLEPFDANEKDDILSVKVLSLKPGSAIVSASIGGLKAECKVTVNPIPVVLSDPKIGDYYYSDGTWSDGGLVSINSDGTNPVWSDPRPAPEAGKTVIGIIFQTDPDRICPDLKEAGFTRGLVMGLCALYDKEQMNNPGYKRLCSFTGDYNFSCLSGTRKTGFRWYNDIYGKRWTERVLDAYKGTALQKCPAFDFATTDYRLPAPVASSGWYVPSIGEIWDFVANFGGDELARYLLQFRDYGAVCESDNYQGTQDDFDVTFFSRDNGKKILSYNPMEKINSVWSLIPEEQRDDLWYCYLDKECQFFSSTIYITTRENGPESCCMFTFNNDNSFDFAPGWVQQDKMICHPVLAF